MTTYAQTQFYRAVVTIGGVAYPIMAGATLSCPQNYSIPAIIGNSWQYNYGQGLRQPTFDCQFALRDKAGECLSPAFLDYFFARTTDVSHDTAEIVGGIVISDGRQTYHMGGVKADSFSIGCSKGDDIRFTARFIGTEIDVPAGGNPPTNVWDRSRPLRFESVNFLGSLDSKVWQFNASFANNHSPNLALDGTAFVNAQNAGMMSAGMTLMVQAVSTLNGGVVDFQTNTTLGGVDPPPIAFAINGTNVQAGFALPFPLDQTPNNMNLAAPRVMRSHQFVGLGGGPMSGLPDVSPQSFPPLVYHVQNGATKITGYDASANAWSGA